MDRFFRIELRRFSRAGDNQLEGARHYRRGTAPAAAAYRRGAKALFERDGRRQRFDYSRKRGVVFAETMAPEGAAAFAFDSEALWEEVERVEKRKDALLAHELLVSLPRDIPLERCLPPLLGWVRNECVNVGMVADLAVHTYGSPLDASNQTRVGPDIPSPAETVAEVLASGVPIYPLQDRDLLRRMPPDHHHAWQLPDGKLLVYQPHVHILLTTREIGPEGFGKKVKAWGQRRQLYRWRQTWAETYNELIKEAGRAERVTDVGRWRRDVEAKKSAGRICESRPTSEEEAPRTIDIRGGHWAAREGRPPKNKNETATMTKSAFNERVRTLAKREAAFQARVEAAEGSQDELIEAIARIQDLTDQGLDLDLENEAGVLIGGAAHLLTDMDAKMLARHRKVLAKVFAPQPVAPASVDQALSDAMALVYSLERDLGVTFFRTEKGSLGYEPAGVVPPETYKMFAGMHEAILRELDRRKLAKLLAKGRAKLAEQKQQLDAAVQERGKLQRTLEQERADRSRYESSAEALFESARTGKPLPDIEAEAPLLQKLRHVILGYRQKVTMETERADKAERAREALEKTVAMLWRSVHHLVRGLGSIAGWAARRQPALKDGLNMEYDAVFAGLSEEVTSQIELKTVPGLRRDYRLPATRQGASSHDPTGTGPRASSRGQSTTLARPTPSLRPAEKAEVERRPGGAMPPAARWRKDQPER